MAFRPITADEIESGPSVTGFRPVSADEIEVEPTSPSWGESARFVGKNMAAGVGDLFGMALDAMPGQYATTPASMRPSATLKDLISTYIGKPEEEGITGAAADIIGAGARAAVFPEAPIANALIGATTKTGEVLNPDNPLIGSLLGLGTGVAGVTAANKIGNTLTSAGKAFERSSIGAQGKNYVKSLRTQGLIDDAETGDLTTRLGEAIEETANTKGFGFFRDPSSLAVKNQAILDEVGPRVGAGLKAADAAGAKPLVDFNSTNSAVNKLITKSKAEKGQVREAFNEFLEKFTDPVDGWDGTVEGLNSWKSSVGNLAFAGSAKGTLAPAVQRKVLRAIRTDLEGATNKAVISSGAATADDWAKTMREYSNAAELQPIFEEGAARGMGGTWDKAARGLLRTSGGTLTTPTVIGGLLAGNVVGAGAGLATGAGLALVGTPTGQGITGNVLKAAGRAGSKLTDSSLATKLAAGASQIGSKEVSIPVVNGKDVRAAIEKVASNLPPQQKQERDSIESALNKAEAKLKESEKTPAIKKVEAKIDADPIDSTIYEIESGRDPEAKNPVSSASGAFQLIKKTAAKLGVKDVFDIEQNYAGYKKLRAENEARFGSDPVVLYAGHYLGAPLLDKVLKGKALTETEKAQVSYLKNKVLPKFEKIYKSKITKA